MGDHGTLRDLGTTPLEGHVPSVAAGPDHPMRVMTRRAAGLLPGGWDDAARTEVAAFFDGLAPEWHTRVSPQRDAVVADALERSLAGLGLPAAPGGVAVEIGSGIGTYTPMLADRFDTVVAVDVSLEMLRLAPPSPGARVLADAAVLPLPDACARAVVLVNAFLFPAEVDRVLAPDGLVVWVNSSGTETPIHLPAEDVALALPGEWTGVSGGAGIGLWCALRRA